MLQLCTQMYLKWIARFNDSAEDTRKEVASDKSPLLHVARDQGLSREKFF